VGDEGRLPRSAACAQEKAVLTDWTVTLSVTARIIALLPVRCYH